MSELAGPRPRWWVYSIVLGLVLGLILAVAAGGIGSARSVASERRWLAHLITDAGGKVVYHDGSTQGKRARNITVFRRWFGDKVVAEIEIPYSFSVVDEDRIHRAFNEASSISVGPSQTQLEKLFGGQESLEVVRNADYVEVNWVDDDGSGASPTSLKVTSDPIRLSDEVADLAQAMVLSPRSYQWSYGYVCLPEYGPVLAFVQGDRRVEAFFSFQCNHIAIVHDGKSATSNLDPSEDFFRALMKKQFPGKILAGPTNRDRADATQR